MQASERGQWARGTMAARLAKSEKGSSSSSRSSRGTAAIWAGKLAVVVGVVAWVRVGGCVVCWIVARRLGYRGRECGRRAWACLGVGLDAREDELQWILRSAFEKTRFIPELLPSSALSSLLLTKLLLSLALCLHSMAAVDQLTSYLHSTLIPARRLPPCPANGALVTPPSRRLLLFPDVWPRTLFTLPLAGLASHHVAHAICQCVSSSRSLPSTKHRKRSFYCVS
jgi:hypothetical protein